jgi:2-oxo-4-hydroxy-4-carboxy-5-ureidoimidazoline decarboxylase
VDRVRCELIPDGGLARLRLVGLPSPAGRAAAGLRWWNALPVVDAAAQVAACNASHAWATALAAGRPFADLDGLAAASERILATTPWPNIEQALAAHPRIGRPADGGDRESAASRAEQSGVSGEPGLRAALAEANRAYEHRFGHVFLARARGRSGDELLGLLRGRLDNDDETERAVVRRELAEITSLRLRELW